MDVWMCALKWNFSLGVQEDLNQFCALFHMVMCMLLYNFIALPCLFCFSHCLTASVRWLFLIFCNFLFHFHIYVFSVTRCGLLILELELDFWNCNVLTTFFNWRPVKHLTIHAFVDCTYIHMYILIDSGLAYPSIASLLTFSQAI